MMAVVHAVVVESPVGTTAPRAPWAPRDGANLDA